MTSLRKAAKGQSCMVRLPGICQFGTETTVLAHIRLAGITGGKFKSPDLLGAWSCYPCHMAIDGHIKTDYTKDALDLMHLQGVMRTQNELIRQGKVRW